MINKFTFESNLSQIIWIFKIFKKFIFCKFKYGKIDIIEELKFAIQQHYTVPSIIWIYYKTWLNFTVTKWLTQNICKFVRLKTFWTALVYTRIWCIDVLSYIEHCVYKVENTLTVCNVIPLQYYLYFFHL